MNTANYLFYSEVTVESVQKILDFLGNCDKDKINIYLSSPGGDVNLSNALTDYINTLVNEEGIEINIICIGEISSAGLVLLMNTDCNVKLEKSAYGVFHIATRRFDYREQKSLFDGAEFKKKALETYNEYLLGLLKKYKIDEDKIEKIKQGKDAYLSRKEIQNILKEKNG